MLVCGLTCCDIRLGQNCVLSRMAPIETARPEATQSLAGLQHAGRVLATFPLAENLKMQFSRIFFNIDQPRITDGLGARRTTSQQPYKRTISGGGFVKATKNFVAVCCGGPKYCVAIGAHSCPR